MPVIKKNPKLDWRSKKKLKIALISACTIIFLACSSAAYHYGTRLPENISYEGELHYANEIEFLTDLTYEKKGEVYHDQMIFNRLFQTIEEADEFIILDMFLFNDEYDRERSFPSLATDLAQTLIDKKQQNPDVEILVMSDRINTFYGAYSSEIFNELEENDIHVVLTNMTSLKDSNPVYSMPWRKVFQWGGTSGYGWLPNPFSPDSPKVTLRSYLELLNFKANHRKVVVTEKEGMITSANPHDGSGFHSNIGFVFNGDILGDLIESELAVAKISNVDEDWLKAFQIKKKQKEEGVYQLQLLTEGKIKTHLLEELKSVSKNDRVQIGVFYLSDRDVIKELLAASGRGVQIRLILDANHDAFGREKNGIPNRPVAEELITKSNGNIQVRWYHTNGEQYHSKIIFIEKEEESTVLAGSANFTRRNLADYNLESNIKITANSSETLMIEMHDYFDMLWTNDQAHFTIEYEHYADDSIVKKMLYRFQEWSGMSTF